jgi:hypothetical protein
VGFRSGAFRSEGLAAFQIGGCGLCAIAYVEGDVIHKDTCLNAEERARYFCPCVSRAAGRVVLAL